MGELYIDMTTGANRQHLPPEKQPRYEPAKLYELHKQRVQQSSNPEIQQLWQQGAEFFRMLKLHDIKEKLIAKQDEQALLAYIKHLPEDPQLLEAIFCLTPEIFGRLQQAFRSNMAKIQQQQS